MFMFAGAKPSIVKATAMEEQEKGVTTRYNARTPGEGKERSESKGTGTIEAKTNAKKQIAIMLLDEDGTRTHNLCHRKATPYH